MKLHCAPGACSPAVHIASREISAPSDSVVVGLAPHMKAGSGDSRAVSVRANVPLLQADDGSHRTKTASLRQYVASACAFTIAKWPYVLALPLTPYPYLASCLDRVSKRPRVLDAVGAEGWLN